MERKTKMGMDVYGKNPSSEVGTYFRRNVWGWHPLWEYVENVHPNFAEKVAHAHSNDGDGLESDDSTQLAIALRADLMRGDAQEYIDERNKYLSELERPTCEYCKGTGIRSDAVGIENKMPERELETEMAILMGRTHGFCNACRGEGKTDAWESSYSLDLDDIKEFADFLENCGGFEIC
jgi:hypothetical protein